MIDNQPWTINGLTTNGATTGDVTTIVLWSSAPVRNVPASPFRRLQERFRKAIEQMAAACVWADVALAITGLERSAPPTLARLSFARPRTCALSARPSSGSSG